MGERVYIRCILRRRRRVEGLEGYDRVFGVKLFLRERIGQLGWRRGLLQR